MTTKPIIADLLEAALGAAKRLLPEQSVDGIMASCHRTAAKLERLAQDKLHEADALDEEAGFLSDELLVLNALSDAATADAEKALAQAERVRSLLSSGL